jgi:hypothetical protein
MQEAPNLPTAHRLLPTIWIEPQETVKFIEARA